jgi:hypothetical protein
MSLLGLAVIHEYQGEGAILKCHAWKDCLGDLTLLKTNNVDFCMRFVQMNQLFGSNSNVIVTQQTCGRLSSKAVRSKRRALAFYFPVQICYTFPISKRREESDLGLCMTSGLAQRMRLRGGDS